MHIQRQMSLQEKEEVSTACEKSFKESCQLNRHLLKKKRKKAIRKNVRNVFDTGRTSHNIHTTEHKYAQQQ